MKQQPAAAIYTMSRTDLIEGLLGPAPEQGSVLDTHVEVIC